MTPVVVWGYLEGRTYRPVYDMAGGGEWLTMRDMVRGDLEVAELRVWADAVDVARTTVIQRLRRGLPIIDALDRRRYQRSWDNGLPFERDLAARAFVEAHPGGAGLREVGDHLGITKEAVRLIEMQALAEAEARMPPELRSAWVAAFRDRHEDV